MKFVSHRRGRTTGRAQDAKRQARDVLHRSRAGALILGLAAAAAVAVPATASASTGAAPAGASAVVGHVYVNDNTKGTNTIGAFNRHADGTLTPEPGSPFGAGGAGTGTGLSDQGAIQITPDGRFLIAVDAGSNQISVLRIHFDGSLSLVRHGVVSSGGTLPDSVAVHGNLVYVANSGTGAANYTGFRLGFDGRLFPIPGSTVTLAANAAPADVLFNGTGSKLAGTEVGTSVIDSFTVGFDGRLTAAPGSPFPAQGPGPFGSEFRPTNPGQLFVSNAHNVGAAVNPLRRQSAPSYHHEDADETTWFPRMNTSFLLYVLVDSGSRLGASYATPPKHHGIPGQAFCRGGGRDDRGTHAAGPGRGRGGAAGPSVRGAAARQPAGWAAAAARRAHRCRGYPAVPGGRGPGRGPHRRAVVRHLG